MTKLSIEGIKTRLSQVPVSPAPQKILNGEVHDWYRIIHGYTDHLVSGLIEEFELKPRQLVLDPFCGTGTTLVECMKHRIDSVGIDANPSSFFAARVKTNWNLDPQRLIALCTDLRTAYHSLVRQKHGYRRDPTYSYLKGSGFIERGWISPKPMRKVIAIKRAIQSLKTNWLNRDAFTLALMAETVSGASNVKFGPELYCGVARSDADVLAGVIGRIKVMAADLELAADTGFGKARVLLGDARKCNALLKTVEQRKIDAVICSPPYPTEHDYTRNARLELALLETVVDQTTLQLIKRRMIRSHTKNIYSGDNDARLVAKVPAVESIARRLDRKVAKLEHGFARYYPTVIREYFGGMSRHFFSVKYRLKKDAICAYVVGDQCSYLQEFVPTARILSGLARRAGFEVLEIRRWRGRRPSTGKQSLDENVLILRNAP